MNKIKELWINFLIRFVLRYLLKDYSIIKCMNIGMRNGSKKLWMQSQKQKLILEGANEFAGKEGVRLKIGIKFQDEWMEL